MNIQLLINHKMLPVIRFYFINMYSYLRYDMPKSLIQKFM